MKKIILSIIISSLTLPLIVQAATLKASYPRLANYFLKWEISDTEAQELAKWDLLILDMETQENSRDQIIKIRELNPKIIILAYITSQEIIDDIRHYNNAYLRQELRENIHDGWWLKDSQGNKVSNWPYTNMLNLSDGAKADPRGLRFNDYLPEFVVTRLKASGLWDGVFYDNTWGDVTWVNNKSLDLDNNLVADDSSESNRLWADGFKKMLAKTRNLAGPDFIIIGNGRVYDGYQSLLNGMMLESFPSFWENGGTWSGSMKTYLKLPTVNVAPQLPVINIYDKNQANYRHFRYGLASTLLGDGFYSYDYDVTSHGQTWWYDEYNVDLGPALSRPYNLLLNNNSEIKPGLWRRDFKNGSAIVNSSGKKQTYVFNLEEFEKIKGEQSPLFNNGQRINYIQLDSDDGILLLKRSTLIKNYPFTNGYFFRVFDWQGRQNRNGFFSYLKSSPGEAEIISVSSSEDSQPLVNLSASGGQVNLFKNAKITSSFYPFSKSFKATVSLAAELDNGDIKKIVVGAGPGGGPQVLIFNTNGKLLGSWFAYDKKLRGGVNVAIADINNDAEEEIITGPGRGEEPLIKIFSLKGILKNSFLAYDKKFQGGVNVAAGDVNGDGEIEIITAPASGGGPQIRIFNSSGRALKSWFAYDKNFRGGIKVTVGDIDENGELDILAGLKNFY